jgi:hypothetical protein
VAIRTANLVLRELVQETGCSFEALASRINRAGAERHLRLTYGRSALSQWISGHVPPPRVRELCAVVLSSKLGRAVTADQIWPETTIRQALVFDPSLPSSIRLLEALVREDVDRRESLINPGYVAGAAVVPAWHWLFIPGEDHLSTGKAPRRVGQREITRMYQALRQFDQLDHSTGGASARAALTRYLSGQVVPVLAAACDAGAGRDRFALAALLTRKAALMASDDNRPGLAQAYFAQALRLATASGDRAIGAHVLVSMSHQATNADDPVAAAGLADAACQGAGKAAPPILLAKIAIMRARADARLGHRRNCLHQIGQALDWFAAASTGPWWAANVTSGYMHGQIAYCYLDLGDSWSAHYHALDAVGAHSPRHVRRRAIGGFLLARIYAEAGEPEEAVQAAEATLSVAGELASSRTLGELRLLRSSMRRYRHLPAVRDFLGHTRVGAATTRLAS